MPSDSLVILPVHYVLRLRESRHGQQEDEKQDFREVHGLVFVRKLHRAYRPNDVECARLGVVPVVLAGIQRVTMLWAPRIFHPDHLAGLDASAVHVIAITFEVENKSDYTY